MIIYVINKNGTPLMPCKPSKARKLLRDGKAKVIRREPFTIKLNWLATEYIQELTLGIDSGSKTIGSAVRDDKNQVYYLSEIVLRQDVKSKMDQRRMYRRNRRARKTRYRKARFLNRNNSTKSDRYPPTIISKFDGLIRELKFVYKLLPIKKLIGVTYNTNDAWRYATDLEISLDSNYNFGDLFIPKASNISNNYNDGVLSDGWYGKVWNYTGQVGAKTYRHGGAWTNASNAGLFYADVNNAVSHSSTSTGGRLARE